MADLSVCLRGKVPAAVSVELSVARSGAVRRAKQRGKGAVAQCVAGVFAVARLPATGKAYVAVVSVPTRAAGPAGSIDVDLRGHSAQLNECYDKEARRRTAKLAGRVVLRFLVKPDGRIVEPEVQSSTLNSLAVERCLTDRLATIRVSPRRDGKTMAMSFALNFDGKRRGPGSVSSVGDSALTPQKRGPLAGAVLSRVMNARKAKFSACYDRVARAKPTLTGRVVLRFTVRGDGTVRNVKIKKSTLNNSQVEDCIVDVGETLRFPGEQGRAVTKVWYPFAFSRAAR